MAFPPIIWDTISGLPGAKLIGEILSSTSTFLRISKINPDLIGESTIELQETDEMYLYTSSNGGNKAEIDLISSTIECDIYLRDGATTNVTSQILLTNESNVTTVTKTDDANQYSKIEMYPTEAYLYAIDVNTSIASEIKVDSVLGGGEVRLASPNVELSGTSTIRLISPQIDVQGDITSASSRIIDVTGNLEINTSQTTSILSENAPQLSSIYVDHTNGVNIAHEDASLYAGIDINLTSGHPALTMSGCINLTQATYIADFAALQAGAANHYVTFEPTGNVTIDSTGLGNLFILENNCGAAFDVVPSGAETFNGAASFTVNNGTTYLFIQSNAGKYKVL